MNIFPWVLFGIIIGILAHILDSSSKGRGILGTIFLGIVGAFVGGVLANLIFGVGMSEYTLSVVLISIFGSISVLLVGRALRNI